MQDIALQHRELPSDTIHVHVERIYLCSMCIAIYRIAGKFGGH